MVLFADRHRWICVCWSSRSEDAERFRGRSRLLRPESFDREAEGVEGVVSTTYPRSFWPCPSWLTVDHESGTGWPCPARTHARLVSGMGSCRKHWYTRECVNPNPVHVRFRFARIRAQFVLGTPYESGVNPYGIHPDTRMSGMNLDSTLWPNKNKIFQLWETGNQTSDLLKLNGML